MCCCFLVGVGVCVVLFVVHCLWLCVVVAVRALLVASHGLFFCLWVLCGAACEVGLSVLRLTCVF